MLRVVFHSGAVILLTLLTQLGGIAWLVAIPVRRPVVFLAVFLTAYASLWGVARATAPQFGRVAVPCSDQGPDEIAALSPVFCVLNRTYVHPEVAAHGRRLAAHMDGRFPGTRVRVLDGGFPFLTGFPMLPHLSHDDGEKLDYAFFYTDLEGRYLPGKAKWALGYWAYSPPRPGEQAPCAERDGLSLRWDFGWLQPVFDTRSLEPERTSEMLRWLARNPGGDGYKILVEPHLAARLGASGLAVRFQGCRAARHDDHVHVEFRPSGAAEVR